jgi:hypothetical protein
VVVEGMHLQVVTLEGHRIARLRAMPAAQAAQSRDAAAESEATAETASEPAAPMTDQGPATKQEDV